MDRRLHFRSCAGNPDIEEPTSSIRKVKRDRYVTLSVGLQRTSAEIRNQKPRKKNEKVIYQPSLDQNLRLAVATVIDGEPGDIAYWLRYRGSKERYYDGNRGVFVGEELQNDPSVTQLTELDDVDSS